MNLENTATDLIDIETVYIDKNLTRGERIFQYNNQMKFSKSVMCKGIIVNISYANKGIKLDDCLRNIIR